MPDDPDSGGGDGPPEPCSYFGLQASLGDPGIPEHCLPLALGVNGTPSIKIDIWSDVACPWCYIGKRRLEAGLEAFATDPAEPPVEVEYHSFELSPDTPVDFAGSEVDFLMGHKGLAEPVVRQMIDRVVSLAAEVGLAYDYDALQHTNTVRAHQLLHHAKAHGKQLEMKERLLAAYFVEGRHIGLIPDLAGLAAEVGLDPDEAARALEQGTYIRAVDDDKRQAASYGIGGVPFYVVDQKFGISGAQEPDTFAEVLRTAARERVTGAATGR